MSTTVKPVRLRELRTIPAEGVVRIGTVTTMFSLSPATIWRKVKRGEFPKPIRLGANSVGWRVETLRNHLAQLSEAA